MDMKRKMDAAMRMVEVMDVLTGERIKDQMGSEEKGEEMEPKEPGESEEEDCEELSPVDSMLKSKQPKKEGMQGEMVAIELDLSKKKPQSLFQKPKIERA